MRRIFLVAAYSKVLEQTTSINSASSSIKKLFFPVAALLIRELSILLPCEHEDNFLVACLQPGTCLPDFNPADLLSCAITVSCTVQDQDLLLAVLTEPPFEGKISGQQTFP